MEVALSSRHSLRRLVAHAHTRALSHSGSLARTASIDSGLSLCVFSPCLYLHLLGVCAVGGYFLEFLRGFCALISIEYRFGVCGVRFATVVARVSERVILEALALRDGQCTSLENGGKVGIPAIVPR